MSQNFTNCHTKIRHVDAHATLNDGVVVQVMGLLSNNNQALRRFMQTFVLAPEVGSRLPALRLCASLGSGSPGGAGPGFLCGGAAGLQGSPLSLVLPLQGSVANKFYVHNDIFRYQDEVFGGFITEPQDGTLLLSAG